MLHRCKEDVRINVKVYHTLLAEAKGKNWKNAFKLTFKLFECLQKQEQYGWKVDVEYSLKLGFLEVLHRQGYCSNDQKSWRFWRQRSRANITMSKNHSSNQGIRSIGGQLLRDDPRLLSHRLVGGPFSRISFRRVDSTQMMKQNLPNELRMGTLGVEYK